MGLNVGHQGESDSRRPDLSEKLEVEMLLPFAEGEGE